VALVSGGSAADPRTPPALPGMPPPFLGTAVVASGGLTAAIDAYGNVVELRMGPAGRALVENPAERQAAGTVAADTGIVARARVDDAWLPLWRADSVEQRYRAGTNVLVVSASFGRTAVRIAYAVQGGALACLTNADGMAPVRLGSREPAARSRLRCDDRAARRAVLEAERSDREWLTRARPLGPGAPAWASDLYERSLLTLRALTDRRSGAVAAGARDGWAYAWPRDAGAVALAFAAAGYAGEARRVARFLLGLELDAAARFSGDGTPVPSREAQGDASGWVAVAARAAGLPAPAISLPWRDRADYQERERGDYLGNALAAGKPPGRLTRRIGDPGSGLDSTAAWAVRPFAQPALFPAARRAMLRLAAGGTRFGIVPSQDWDGVDPWSAPTAWTVWSLAALGERPAALRLLAALRRSATPAGALPERVDVRTGVPRSATPLAWSHAFAVLALRELWP
jgi:glucoamylase